MPGALKSPAKTLEPGKLKDYLIASVKSKKLLRQGPGGGNQHPIRMFLLALSAPRHIAPWTRFNWRPCYNEAGFELRTCTRRPPPHWDGRRFIGDLYQEIAVTSSLVSALIQDPAISKKSQFEKSANGRRGGVFPNIESAFSRNSDNWEDQFDFHSMFPLVMLLTCDLPNLHRISDRMSTHDRMTAHW